MIDDTPETSPPAEKFDQSPFPEDALIHDRRGGSDRRSRFPARADNESTAPPVPKERRARKERRRRIDPTTFEKQYTDDELEFMNAMQQFKVQSCKSFPTHGDVLRVAHALGYRKVTAAVDADPQDDTEPGAGDGEPEPTVELGSALSES
jgi:hypothetical protein